MRQIINVTVGANNNRSILTDIYFVDNDQPKPAVIFSHGFKGFKDWGDFKQIAKRFAKAGFMFIKYNFSHNGTTLESPTEFEDLEAFGNNNYSLELEDLGSIIDWLEDNKALKTNIDYDRLYLIGHSRGGAVSLIKAAEDERVKKLITWAAFADFEKRLEGVDLQQWKKEGVRYIKNSRTGQEMPQYYQFYEDLVQNKERLNVGAAAKSLNIPYLVVHGSDDEAVPVEDAKTLNKWCSGSELFIVEGTGHTFGGKHPYTSKELPEATGKVLEKSIAFFLEET